MSRPPKRRVPLLEEREFRYREKALVFMMDWATSWSMRLGYGFFAPSRVSLIC